MRMTFAFPMGLEAQPFPLYHHCHSEHQSGTDSEAMLLMMISAHEHNSCGAPALPVYAVSVGGSEHCGSFQAAYSLTSAFHLPALDKWQTLHRH